MASTSSINGIVSGLDTANIIDSLMALERRPAILMEKEQTEKTNIVSALKALQAKLMALTGDVAQLTRRASFESSSVNVSDDKFLTASSSGRGVLGSYDIQVLALARNHQLSSQGFSDQSSALLGTGTISLAIGSGSAKTITVDSSNNSLTGIKNAINDAGVGVRASIINDGSSSKSYRLVLTADKPGAANAIKMTASLAGGETLNYTTPTFDAPEWVSKNSSSTSLLSLGGTASFSGTTNKIYSFTVGGTGTKTIGTDNITIDWTDGTNTGSIVVSQADTEIDLAVAGAQGLKLNFSSGKLVGGDQFQVQTFAPLLQSAADARVSVGAAGGTGSPIIVTSGSNTILDAIPGVKLTLKKTTVAGTPITVTTDVDTSGIKEKISAFIKSYNDVKSYIDKQNHYNKDTTEAGVLFGDSSLFTMQETLSRAVSSTVSGLSGKYKQLAAIGIRTGTDGKLVFREPAKLEEALRADPDALIKLLASTGKSSTNRIEFVSSTEKTKVGADYAVDITSAATQGKFQAINIANPGSTPLALSSTNNRLKLSLNGTESNEMVLEAKTYGSTTELVEEIQSKINADTKIGGIGLTVTWVTSTSTDGHLEFTSSSYGTSSKVNLITSISNTAFTALGMTTGQIIEGQNIKGTINGEKAEGIGQHLTGNAGNKTTDGLKLKITLSTFQVASGDDGKVTVSKGVASRLAESLDSLTKPSNGFVDRRITSYQKQVDSTKERIKTFDALLVMRRESLIKKFAAMESALGQTNATNTFLTNALSGLNSNFSK